jgi:hypothetical protein
LLLESIEIASGIVPTVAQVAVVVPLEVIFETVATA